MADSDKRPTVAAEGSDYCTRSHDIASILVAQGHNLKGFQGDRRRVTYVFADPEGHLEFNCATGSMDFSVTDARQVLEISRNLYREMDAVFGPRPPRNDKASNQPRCQELP